MKKGISVLILIAVFLGMTSSPIAQSTSPKSRLDALTELELVKGGDKAFVLNKAPSIGEAAVLIVKLMGREKEALQMQNKHPFPDVPQNYSPYVGYLYKNKMLSAVKNKASQVVTPSADSKFMVASLLTVLGYDSAKGDFSTQSPFKKGTEIGLTEDSYAKQLAGRALLREDMVNLAYGALGTLRKAGNQTLIQSLIDQGVLSREIAERYGFAMDDRFTVKVEISKNQKGFLTGMIKISSIPFEFKYYRGFSGNNIPEPLSQERIYASGAFYEGDKANFRNLYETSDQPFFQTARSRSDYEAYFDLNNYVYLVLYDENLDPAAYLELPPVKQNKTVIVKLNILDGKIKPGFNRYCAETMQGAAYIDPSVFRIEKRMEDKENKLPAGNYLTVDRSRLPESVRNFKLVGCSGSDTDNVQSNLFLEVRAGYPGRTGGGVQEYVEGKTCVHLYGITMYTLRSADGTILGYSQISYPDGG